MLNDGAGTRDLSSATKQSIARWPSTRVDKARYHHSTRGGSANTRETIVWQCLIRIRWLSSGVKAKCRWATARSQKASASTKPSAIWWSLMRPIKVSLMAKRDNAGWRKTKLESLRSVKPSIIGKMLTRPPGDLLLKTLLGGRPRRLLPGLSYRIFARITGTKYAKILVTK